jgi:hypothetical protein
MNKISRDILVIVIIVTVAFTAGIYLLKQKGGDNLQVQTNEDVPSTPPPLPDLPDMADFMDTQEMPDDNGYDLENDQDIDSDIQ